MLEEYKKYALDVVEGTIVAGEMVRLQCQRFLDWFDRDDIEFRCDRADKPVKFISHLKHTEGEFYNQPFTLLDWQKFLMYGVFGWYYKGTDTRVINNVYVEISRKNGKTSLCSALALYGIVADGEHGAEVDFAAPSREQANIAFRSATHYAESVHLGSKLFHCLRNTITCKPMKSRIRIMSSDSKLGDGFNPGIGIVDEYHAFSDNGVPEVLQSGMGMRQNPIMFYITTAGFDLSGPCKEYRDMCEDILRGNKVDDSVFALIYEMDADDDWTDESNWKKCCPSLGETVKLSYMRNQVNMAKNNPSMEVGVKTKNLNMWCQSEDVWLSDDVVRSRCEQLDLEDFRGCSCYVGLDLAAVSDLTALSIIIDKDGQFYSFSWSFMPQDTYADCFNSQLYRKFRTSAPDKFLVTPGNVTDYDYILDKLVEINEVCPIQTIFYDSWNSTYLIIKATEMGFMCQPFSQSLGSYNRPTKEWERRMLSGGIVIDYNEALLWCHQNTTLKMDNFQNVKPIKGGGKNGKIDLIISNLTAFGGMLTNPMYKTELVVL